MPYLRFLIILPVLFTLLSCEKEEEEDELAEGTKTFSCTFTEQSTINLAGIDISVDFDETNVPVDSLLTKSTCKGFDVGQGSSKTLSRVNRTDNTITVTTGSSETLNYTITETSIEGLSGVIEVEGCKLSFTSSGIIDIANDTAVLNDTLTLEGDPCKKALESSEVQTTSQVLASFTKK